MIRKILHVALLTALVLGGVGFIGLPARAIELIFPLDCSLDSECWIVRYPDRSPRNGVAKDYTCGDLAADGSAGTLISMASREPVLHENARVPVRAAASGVVSMAFDGLGRGNPACGAGVVIDHADGWSTRYCHMAPRSIRVQPAQKVSAGTLLGYVGATGAASWPQLDFAVFRNGLFFDPFTGHSSLEGCGLEGTMLWKQDLKQHYKPLGIMMAGFAQDPPAPAYVSAGEMGLEEASTMLPALTFWARLVTAESDDEIYLKITGPNGDLVVDEEIVMPIDQERPLVYVRKERGLSPWKPGTYRGFVRVTRYEKGVRYNETRVSRIDLKDSPASYVQRRHSNLFGRADQMGPEEKRRRMKEQEQGTKK